MNNHFVCKGIRYTCGKGKASVYINEKLAFTAIHRCGYTGSHETEKIISFPSLDGGFYLVNKDTLKYIFVKGYIAQKNNDILFVRKDADLSVYEAEKLEKIRTFSNVISTSRNMTFLCLIDEEPKVFDFSGEEKPLTKEETEKRYWLDFEKDEAFENLKSFIVKQVVAKNDRIILKFDNDTTLELRQDYEGAHYDAKGYPVDIFSKEINEKLVDITYRLAEGSRIIDYPYEVNGVLTLEFERMIIKINWEERNLKGDFRADPQIFLKDYRVFDDNLYLSELKDILTAVLSDKS